VTKSRSLCQELWGELGKGESFMICMHLAGVRPGLVTGVMITACTVLFRIFLRLRIERRVVVEQYVHKRVLDQCILVQMELDDVVICQRFS
jgi:hypothetical protein